MPPPTVTRIVPDGYLQLKKNISDKWWKDFVERRADCVGVDAALLSNPRVWEASGHVQQFVDPLSECATCRKRVRADKAVKECVQQRQAAGKPIAEHLADTDKVATFPLEQLGSAIRELSIPCPGCGKCGAEGLGTPRTFNLLFQTNVGPVMPGDPIAPASAVAGNADSSGGGAKKKGNKQPSSSSFAYMRPETAQGAFLHFLNVHTATRKRLPFGIGQVGRSFRNEIAVSNFIFRTREFDQMELEYFCQPSDSEKQYRYWVGFAHDWLLKLGIQPGNVRLREYGKKELAHYAVATTDIEYKFPFGWDELWGIANRGDFDLRCHSEASGIDLRYTDPVTNQSVLPHVVEPALGLNRLILAMLSDGLVEETLTDAGGKQELRTVLRLHESIAPINAAVLPLLKKDPQVEVATSLQSKLLQHMVTDMDITQTIGKRYRRQDEIGTPLCITVDPQTLTDGTVTIRDRDSMTQVRLHMDEVTTRAETGKLTQAALFSHPGS